MRHRAATDDTRPRTLLPEIVLVVGLSLLAAWIVRTLAPPSLIRDGQRLPVGLASQPGPGGHHGAADGTLAPSPVSDEPVPHFLGGAFLAAHLLAIALAIGVQLVRRLRARARSPHARFATQLLFATLIATAAGAAAVLAARFGYGDRIAPRDVLLGGVEVARYAFIAALALVVIFGFREDPEGYSQPRLATAARRAGPPGELARPSGRASNHSTTQPTTPL